MNLFNKIKENLTNFLQGKESYIPHPKELGEFSKWFPGRMKGDITCVTGGTSSAKTSFIKFLIFKAIEWAIKNNKNYHVLWFGLEESEDQFDYSLLSFLIYQKSGKNVRYNIEHFEGLGKSIKQEHMKSIEDIMPMFEKYKSYVTFYETVANSHGIYKTIRDFARKRGKFFFEGKPLSDTDEGKQWDKYVPNDPEEFVEVIIDHLGELHVQQDEKDLSDAMTNLVKKLRMYVAKVFKYSIIPAHQQMLEMENLDHIRENQVYASLQGLGDNKRVSRAYLNVIGITNINRYGLQVANTNTGSYNIGQLQDFQRVIGILKRRYGIVHRKTCVYFDGCTGWFEQLPKPGTKEYNDTIEKIKKYISET